MEHLHESLVCRVASRWMKRSAERETHNYTIEMSPEVKKIFDHFLALLHYNSNWGHSAIFGMFLDGDGSAVFEVKKGLNEDPSIRKGVNEIGGSGAHMEIAQSDGFMGEFFDRSHSTYSIKDGDKLVRIEPDIFED